MRKTYKIGANIKKKNGWNAQHDDSQSPKDSSVTAFVCVCMCIRTYMNVYFRRDHKRARECVDDAREDHDSRCVRVAKRTTQDERKWGTALDENKEKKRYRYVENGESGGGSG